jgi:hypothetical protein
MDRVSQHKVTAHMQVSEGVWSRERYGAAVPTLQFKILNTHSVLYLIINQIQRAVSSFKNWLVIQLVNGRNCMEHEAPAIAFTTLS